MTAIRILVVEDDPRFRITLVKLLQSHAEFDVAAAVTTGEDALAMAAAIKPEVILMDLELPGMSGIEATSKILEQLPGCQVVALTHLSDDENLFGAIKAGAAGYLLKDASLPQVVEAIKGACRGEGAIFPTLAPRVLSEFRRLAEQPEGQRELYQALGRREVEVLELIGKGRRNRQIADSLSLSERTVKNHVGSILRKLHLNSRAEAAEVARKRGIVR